MNAVFGLGALVFARDSNLNAEIQAEADIKGQSPKTKDRLYLSYSPSDLMPNLSAMR